MSKGSRIFGTEITAVCTGHANTTARGIIPRPRGHIPKTSANIIVHFKQFSKTSGIPLKPLIKHQYTKTTKSAVLYVREYATPKNNI